MPEIQNLNKVLLFGTFDLLHPGHQNLFEQARPFGDYLITVIARDATVKKLKKRWPKYNEKQRQKNLMATGWVDKVILGSQGDKYQIIKKIKPDIICLGYDQKFFVTDLKQKIKDFGLNTKIVQLMAFKPKLYKSSNLMKIMLDLKFIRENLNLIKKNNRSRNVKVDLEALIKLDDQRKKFQLEIEALRNERNKMSKIKPTETVMIEIRKLGNKVKELEEKFRWLENQINEILYQIPNLNHETVPIGKNGTENQVIDKAGEKPKFDFGPKQHFEVLATKNLIDTQTGAKVSGSRFFYLKGPLVLVERAIMEYGLQKAISKGFEPILPPILVRERAMFGTGFFPAEKNEVYAVNPDEDDLFLIGTAEVSLVAMHADEIFKEKELPKKYCAVTPCFRREAGSYGKDQQGILRVHQFYKVEMVAFCRPEDSWVIHEELLTIEKELLDDFGLHYQIINICSGDLGYPASKKYDLEGWFPGQNKYRELTSTSNTTDFQARRLNIKYQTQSKKGGQENVLVHTLNGTMVADRTLLAIIENYQQKDGHVLVPEVLRKYTGFDQI